MCIGRYVGVDSGSVSIHTVVMDEDCTILEN
jgi:activator of 2-hydroxyglutaryl-CoA dehydratase